MLLPSLLPLPLSLLPLPPSLLPMLPSLLPMLMVLQLTAASEPEKWFATRTSYIPMANTDTSQVTLEDCDPVLLYVVARHGARIPNEDLVLQWQSELPEMRDQVVDAWLEGRGNLTDMEVEALVSWELVVGVEDSGQLMEAGREEHRGMGQRWRERLGGKLDLSLEKTAVRASSSERCKDSGEAFLGGIGLAGANISIRDDLVRFYDYCPKYTDEVVDNDQTWEQGQRLEASQEWREMMDRVSAKVGVHLDKDKMELAWEICRYERAWFYSENSPWCIFFTSADLALYNFREDLYFYYFRGYGYNITAQMTQPLLADMLTSLEHSENTAVLNFGHSDTVGPLLTALGLFKDPSDLVAEDLGKDHLYDVSRIGCFTTNLDLVVFQCPTERRVIMFHQETALEQPACGGTVCTLDQVLQYYSPLASADFGSVCSV